MDEARDGQKIEPNEQKGEQKTDGLNRREFIGALAGAAAAGTLLNRPELAQAQQAQTTYWYYDSYGNVVQADPASVAAGVYPPPLPEGVTPPGSPPGPTHACSTSYTYVSGGGFVQPNILLIMVDQLRFPRWLTSFQQTIFTTQIMPNVFGSGGLIAKSYSFQNYYVAATMCTPSRATLLTGLYPQQTCIFKTGPKESILPPSLQPYKDSGFPTIGDVLAQFGGPNLLVNCTGDSNSLPYDSAWIGKWHLSDFNFGADPTGANGPRDYGFTSAFCIPTSGPATPAGTPFYNAYASPDGYENEGSAGHTLGNSTSPPWIPTFTYNTLATPADPLDINASGLPHIPPSPYKLSDAAIYRAFSEFWLTASHTEPWFLALSFINPHDIGYFPWGFGLATSANGQACGPNPMIDNFGCAAQPEPPGLSFYPPPVLGFSDSYNGDTVIQFSGLPYTMYNANGGVNHAPPSDWNNTDNPQHQLYNDQPGGKPGLQAYFKHYVDGGDGTINNTPAWCTFLNYYYWLQNLVDTLIGNVLFKDIPTLSGTPPIIIFTSDHGDYGGSHVLHEKGGALYDEIMNVPFLVQFPNQVGALTPAFSCSSVDVLPFIYTAALGNHSWRTNMTDMIYYLNGREAIYDFIFNDTTASQRRVALVPNSQGGIGLPYVLHTTDEFSNISVWNDSSTPQPSHAIAIRTIDRLWINQEAHNPFNYYGGGKLGMYSYWDGCSTFPNVASQVQFEFYDYYTGNYGEQGNNAWDGPTTWNANGAGTYLNAYNNIMAGELYNIYGRIGTAHNTAFNVYMAYLNAAEGFNGMCGFPSGSPPIIPTPTTP